MPEPTPGVLHPVDQAFYDLAIKERDYERHRVDVLSAAVNRLRFWAAGDVSRARGLAQAIANAKPYPPEHDGVRDIAAEIAELLEFEEEQ